jgi:hypothetical protein
MDVSSLDFTFMLTYFTKVHVAHVAGMPDYG